MFQKPPKIKYHISNIYCVSADDCYARLEVQIYTTTHGQLKLSLNNLKTILTQICSLTILSSFRNTNIFAISTNALTTTTTTTTITTTPHQYRNTYFRA